MDMHIICCPVCGSTVDVTASQTQFDCVNCGQQWIMTIDPSRLAQYALQ
jgi:predicted RNA-binding Zn-ribbon protein involved in translation (DUF1610 family)